jgi:GAF domain-containing protein
MRDDAPLGHNPAVQAVKGRVAIVINDSAKDERVLLKRAHSLRGIRSMVSLPIIGAGEVVAIFNLYASEEGFFDDAEMRLLHELAGDIAFAIENLAKQQRLAYLKRVTDFASGINALIVRATNRDELFRDACEIAVDNGGFPMALLGILDSGGTKIAIAGLAGKNKAALDFTRKVLSAGSVAPNLMVAQAINGKAPVISNDSQNDSRVAHVEKHIEFAGRSLAIFPIIVSGVVIAVLALYTAERDFFHDEEIRLLKELIANIAFAVDHLEKVDRLANIPT